MITSTALEALTPVLQHIEAELPRTFTGEVDLTGNMLFSIETASVWFEVKFTGYGDKLRWLTADMAERAEPRETLVYVESREEALTYDESN